MMSSIEIFTLGAVTLFVTAIGIVVLLEIFFPGLIFKNENPKK